MTHICVSKQTIIGSDNGLSPGRRQAIIWTNAGILSIGPLGTNFSENLIEILTFSFKKMRLNVSPAKWRPFCLGLNVIIWGVITYPTGARLDARTYTLAHPIWRTINAARKHGAISPILPVFCRYYRCDAIMLIKLSTVWPWVTGITTLEVAIVIVNFARDARMNTVNVCRMRERIKQDARTSLLMRERTHIVRCGSFN